MVDLVLLRCGSLNIIFYQDFLPKLKQHLLQHKLGHAPNEPNDPEKEFDPTYSILFKHDRIYQHNIMRVNFTTYDVRRSQDTLHTSSSQNNIIVLNKPNRDDENSSSVHPFRYAQILGIYHANVVYVGQGVVDYQPRRTEFLWVRWYQRTESDCGWLAQKLDRIQFSPMADDSAFGFIHPSDILRGCHIIPAFSQGKRHPDGMGLSRCAQDARDYKTYFVNR